MNFGMRCHDICRPGTVTEVLDHVAENGILQIQLAMSKSFTDYDFSYGHYSPGMAHYVRNELDKRGIHVAVLGCYINPVNPDELKRQAEVNRFIEHLKYAKILGADMVGTETGRYDVNGRQTPYTYTEGCYQLLLKSMREIVAAAEKLGVTVGVEAVHNHTLYCPEMMHRFLRDIDSPNVDALLDPVNLINGENYKDQDRIIEKAFQLYGDRITMLHIKDFVIEDGQPKTVDVGEGWFHYETVLKWLKKEKPQIAMLLENSAPSHCHKDIEHLEKIAAAL